MDVEEFRDVLKLAVSFNDDYKAKELVLSYFNGIYSDDNSNLIPLIVEALKYDISLVDPINLSQFDFSLELLKEFAIYYPKESNINVKVANYKVESGSSIEGYASFEIYTIYKRIFSYPEIEINYIENLINYLILRKISFSEREYLMRLTSSKGDFDSLTLLLSAKNYPEISLELKTEISIHSVKMSNYDIPLYLFEDSSMFPQALIDVILKKGDTTYINNILSFESRDSYTDHELLVVSCSKNAPLLYRMLKKGLPSKAVLTKCVANTIKHIPKEFFQTLLSIGSDLFYDRIVERVVMTERHDLMGILSDKYNTERVLKFAFLHNRYEPIIYELPKK